MFDLTGKVAVVTGGSRGLGRADCLALARAGADVVVTDILIESDPDLQQKAQESGSVLAQFFSSQNVVYAEATSEEIRGMGRRSVAIRMDVTNREQIADVFKQIAAEFGSIDILVNNAATLDHVAQVDAQNDDLWDRDVKVNLTGAFNCTKAAFPYMRERGWGRRLGVVLGDQGGGDRPGQVGGPGGGALRHHLQRRRPGDHRHRGLQDGQSQDERPHGPAHRDARAG